MIEFGEAPVLRTLEKHGIELDQRLRQAFELPGTADLHDGKVLLALCRLNAISSRFIDVDHEELEKQLFTYIFPRDTPPVSCEKVRLRGGFMKQLLEEALKFRRERNTLGVGDYLQAVASVGLRTGDSYKERPFSIDLLAHILGASQNEPLSTVPGLRDLLGYLQRRGDAADDFQYIVALEGDKLVFRVSSVIDDYVQENDSGLWVPQRALLTHLGDIGLFTRDQVEELDELMNSPNVKEREFQTFFERYPHFLRKWDHREVHPHVCLTRGESGPLIPDFILTNKSAQDAAILDIKRTLGGRKKLIRRQDNRVRFTDAIQESCAQLRTYRRWFEVPDNRQMLGSKVGMEIYNPRLIVIIGRASEFTDEIERATLRADNPDIEIVTYDDIHRHARDRMVVVRGASGF